MYQITDAIEGILEPFRGCFSRKATFEWMRVQVLGLMTRQDFLGVTSTVRALSLCSEAYDSLLGMFKSDGWNMAAFRNTWYGVVTDTAPLLQYNDRCVLCSDGVKVSCEGSHMPAVKKLHQESSDSSKGEYIFGRLYGAVGVLTGAIGASICIPLKIDLQDGMKGAVSWDGADKLGISNETHIVQSMQCAFEAAEGLGHPCYLVQDRYFLAVPSLRRFDRLTDERSVDIQIVTKAKRDCVAYTEPPKQEQKQRGRPRLKGDKVRLRDLFESSEFEDADCMIAGKICSLKVLSQDLLWGGGLYKKMRFVLVKDEKNDLKEILTTTDLSLLPCQVVELYHLRWGIECAFRDMKQDIAGFACSFWTNALPALDRFAKKGCPRRLDSVTDEHDRIRILSCYRACERFVALACVALGILQILTLDPLIAQACLYGEYRRTQTKGKASVRTMRSYVRSWIMRAIHDDNPTSMARFIADRLVKEGGYAPKGLASVAS